MTEWLKFQQSLEKPSINKVVPFLIVVVFITNSLYSQSVTSTDSGNIHGISDINPGIEFISPTFLGNGQRCYYGNTAPDTLALIWKHYLGKGETVISRKAGSRIWAGAGWTGQPLLVKENGQLFLIQGAYDHHLKKINAETGNLVWQYAFDDVIKGTGTIWKAPDSIPLNDRYVIFQGSRLGVGNYLDSKNIPSYRAISYITGKEQWRLDVKWTKSYSRDVDGSCLVINDTIYIGLENSLFTLIDPFYQRAKIKNGMLQPNIYQETFLYNSADVKRHGGNLVTESSPALLNNTLYIASGTGHIWGYSLKSKSLVWDFFIGSDIDGSAVVTHDSCLIVSVEKQYISGMGGVYKLDPGKQPDSAVVWYMPTKDKGFSSWEGGVIGTVGINDAYNRGNLPYLAVINALDGYMYVVEHNKIDSSKQVLGPNLKHKHYKPKVLAEIKTNPSISTPILDSNHIVSAGYGYLRLFSYDSIGQVKPIAKFMGQFEATPVFHNKRIYIASRGGYLYCLGEKRK